jgi:hypothetical protein
MFKAAMAEALSHERFLIKARALGVTDEQASDLLAGIRTNEWLWPFDKWAEADRLLMRLYAEQRPLPPPDIRKMAYRTLLANGQPFTPADADALADAWAQFVRPSRGADQPGTLSSR